MTEDIRALTAQYAADPTSLVFLRLGEGLRQRGQLDAALKVAVSGLSRYPHLPDAHDLYARILTDRHDYASAFDEWDTVLRLAPHHIGAHKGIGFLYHRAGDREQALHHLRVAADLDPGDTGLRQAVERVAGGQQVWEMPVPESTAPRPPEARSGVTGGGDPFTEVEGAAQRLLLVDHDGLRLGGALLVTGGRDVSDEVAATLAGLALEASRAGRLLELGEWNHLTVEGAERSACLLCPTNDTVLLAMMDGGLPAGQLAFYAERGAKAARGWLERVR